MRTVSAFLAAGIGLSASLAHAQGVDYHKAQQAGKVWERKIDRNGRAGPPRVNSAGIAYNAPLTREDRAIVLRTKQANYDRLLNSVGRKNADRWLDQTARIDRSKR